ncbi:auxin-responsive protein IAA1-like [Iris pallida]|uniref:Auxin-responsive protein n=1 Tax=Iris pallida TaxID=29817 RepID=A0AAX6GXI6_IRIPA|nr:auxin-responsive protein IAA1-like [Iris pallida]
MSTETGKSSTESEEVSGLDYQETELTLGLPGGGNGSSSSSSRPEPDRKRGFELTLAAGPSAVARRGVSLSVDSDAGRSSAAAKPPSAKAQVVGWPPVRSFRKNALKSCKYVKVAVDGAPYLRKVDLETYSGYQKLLTALEEMFSCFKIRNYSNERKLVDPINGTEYVPTYEDKDGDWMLVGDVPWEMFVASCKRLRLMKSSEAVNLAPRASQGSTHNAR